MRTVVLETVILAFSYKANTFNLHAAALIVHDSET